MMSRAIVGLAFWCCAACGGSPTEPEPRVPAVGRYAYGNEWTGQGTLTVTTASAAQVAATFAVADDRGGVMQGAAQLGMWNVDAYVLYGTVVTTAGIQTQYAHRIAWRADGTAACTVQEVLNANRGQRPCTLRYLGP